jgi:RAD51-like protein 2
VGKVQQSQTALDLIQESAIDFPVPSSIRAMDELLGGGVPVGKITEFCGAPGLGKTQLGIQLAVNAHLPTFMDGPNGHCIYIDTEGSFVPERVTEIADSVVKLVKE